MTIRYLALVGSALILLMIAVACGSSEPAATPTSEPSATPTLTPTPASEAQGSADLGPAEVQYLEAIASIDGAFRDVLVSISEALSITWPTRERLLDVLGEADVSGKLEATRRQAEQLSLPDSLGPDHRRYMRMIDDAVPHLLDHDRAVQAGDLA